MQSVTGAAAAAAPVSPWRPPSAPAADTAVTLITGDTIQYHLDSGGRPVFTATPAPRSDGRTVAFHAEGGPGDFHVYPDDAVPLLSAGVLDRDLFDLPGLVAQGLSDAASDSIPVIVGYAGDPGAARLRADTDALPATEDVVALASVDGAGAAVRRAHAASFWSALTARSLDRRVASVSLDHRVTAVLDRSVPQIGAPEAWAAGYTGAGVTVAVLDTGVDATHPDLAGKIAAEQNFTADPTAADGNGHGTHVASTIAGSGSASNGRYKGVAPDAKLISGKVLGADGNGLESWIIAGMEWATRNGASVVNLSVGGRVTDGRDPLARAVDDLTARTGTLFVIAAGNSGPGGPLISTPGAATSALTVGAVDKGDAMASFSSRGPRVGDHAVKPEITAPGVNIVAARAKGTAQGTPVDAFYTALNGTSMATPHVAGAAALLRQARPDLSGPALKDALVSAAADKGAAWFAQGTGRVDVPHAINTPVRASASVNLGDLTTATAPSTATLTYTNDTGTSLPLALTAKVADRTGVPATGLSLSATSVTVPAHGSAQIAVSVDPAAVAQGVFGGTITATGPGVSLRTGVGYGLSRENRLTVNVVDSTGAAASYPWPIVLMHDDYDPANPVGRPQYLLGPEGGEATEYVPDGVYTAMTTVYEGTAPDFRRASLLAAVEVRVTGNTAITLDARAAVELAARAPQATDMRMHSYAMTRHWAKLDLSYSMAGYAIGKTYPVLASPAAPGALAPISLHDHWVLAQPKPLRPVPYTNGQLSYSDAPGYIYNLQFAYLNGVPANLSRAVTNRDLVSTRVLYHSENPGALLQRAYTAMAPTLGVLWNPIIYLVPGEVTEYVLADDHLTWDRYANLFRNPSASVQYTYPLYSRETFRSAEAGTRRPDEHWFEAPARVGALDVPDPFRANPMGYTREAFAIRGGPDGDQFLPGAQALGNAPGSGMTYFGPADMYARWRMWNTGTGTELPVDWSAWGYALPVFHLDPAAAGYRLEAVDRAPADKVGDLFRTAPTATTVWTFRSARSDAAVPDGYVCGVPNRIDGGYWIGDVCRFQPLIQLGYDLGLDLRDRAPAGRAHTITVRAGTHSQASGPPVVSLTVETSTDGGKTWTAARPTGPMRDGTLTAIVKHPPLDRTDGFVWLRVKAADASGGTVESTVQRAYELT
ncbi:hypothetical protein Afil01_67470 [Actinorhabdospora filicis]|uniref:Peptidase S8/S53 domain-containing protein n=1 Tax=Actinorhabdospora filicis TaxID=1785913 RepID=A0A9W6SS72_9ACTN|nr:S8 family peptidase [Actinorhabdospora filicis]GLZ81940.1 hypothetical protein Afil01_67470 [Actinorhabdospora filicis]